MRAAIYKELKGLDYRELEYHQEDSRICAMFLKIDQLRPYSFQMYQKYISRIVDLSGGKSNLILDCVTLVGNVSYSKLYQPALKRIEKDYEKTPKLTSNNGRYASKVNCKFAQEKGIKNIVSNKIVCFCLE